MRVIRYLVFSSAILLSVGLNAAPAGPALILRAGGIGHAPAIVRFGTVTAIALRRLSGVLGGPTGQRRMADCGQNEPMIEVSYRGHLVLTFFRGRFSGWALDGGSSYATDKGISIGSSRAAIMKAYPGSTVDTGSLGVMFGSADGVSGFLSDDRPGAHVIGLYAGETCMVS
jgi:hypothetical protein